MGTAILIAILSSQAIVALFLGTYIVVEHSGTLRERLGAYAAAAGQTGHPAATGQPWFTSLLSWVGRLLSGRAVGQGLALRLAQANVQLTVPEFLAVSLGAGAGGGVLGLLLRGHPLSAVAGAVVGLALPWLVLERKRQVRIRAFHDQLLDVLVLIIGSLRSGHAMRNALELVAKELMPPASEEFSRVLREMGFGLSQTEALNNLVRRMETDDLQLIVTAVNISHEAGGNLSLVLEKISETIRERVRLLGEIRVLTTQQRLTTYLLAALPVLLGIAMSLMSPKYMMGLLQPPWILIPAGALALEILGTFLALRLTRIDV